MSFLNKWRKPEHQWAEESLSAYIDGELSPGANARLEKHLQECRACRANLATLRQTVALVKELPVMATPRSFAVRPATVRAKAAPAAPSWGYGVLKGATAIAALLLVLLIGGDLALHFEGAPLASLAPSAPEVAMAPAFEPSIVPAPAEEEPLLGEIKEAEPAPAATAPSSMEEMAPAPPPEAPDAYQAAQPVGTPTVSAEPAEAPLEEGEARVAGQEEATPASETTPVPSPALEAEGPLPQPTQPCAASPVEEDGQRAALLPATATPEAAAMAEVAQPGEADRAEQVAVVLPLTPLRLAELTVLAVLLVLAVATALTAWLRRRAS